MRSRGWAELYDWRLDRDSATPVFRQIYAQVRAAVLARTLGPGTRLPSSRALAVELGAARRRHRATLRRTPAAPASARAFAEFAPSTAQADDRPFNTGRTLVDARTIEIWRKLTHRAVRTLGPQHLGYTDPRGLPELRRSIAEYLQAARGVRADPEQIVVTGAPSRRSTSRSACCLRRATACGWRIPAIS